MNELLICLLAVAHEAPIFRRVVESLAFYICLEICRHHKFMYVFLDIFFAS